MLNNIYRGMIEDSPIPYIHIKIVRDELGYSKQLKIVNYNKAYEKVWIKNNNINYVDCIIEPKNDEEKEKWNELSKIINRDKKYTIEGYVDSLDKHLNVDIYGGKEDEFHIRLSKVSSQHIKLSSSLKNSPFLVFIKDRDGRYLDVNNKLLEALNLSYDEIVGKTNFDILDKSLAKILRQQDEAVLTEKRAEYINPAFEKVYGFKPDELYEDINKWYEHWDGIEFIEEAKEYEYARTDETTFKIFKEGQEDKWIWSRFTPVFDEQGNIVKKIGILSDITDKKKLEDELDKIKMDFFANLSHELRTPINLIFSALQVLILKFDKLDPETREYFNKYIGIISQNGHRLLRLVNNLIDTTKLDSGSFDYNPQNGDIVSCVEDICMSVSTFVNQNDLEIIFDTDEEEKIVSFDADNMERIVLNLLSNAIKFSKANGKIEVNLSCKEDIKISVKDSGVGIPKDKIESIFGRFEQVKGKYKKEREGSGIGLALVKSLVEMHDGNIAVNSEPGLGSEFIITLPDVLQSNQNGEITHQLTYMSDINRLRTELSDVYI